MNRYVLKFCKLGNMRFISHLDLVRLFKRAIRRAGIKVAYSNGYNPHELINVVQPLSLGYESSGEYFEIDTLIPYEENYILDSLNSSMPEGIKFAVCREKERTSGNLSSVCEWALYEAVLPLKSGIDMPSALEGFLAQPSITISKIDKKKKKQVDKEIKQMIRQAGLIECTGGCAKLRLILRCASNETLNPGKLIESFFKYAGIETDLSECRFTRQDLQVEKNGKLVSLYESF